MKSHPLGMTTKYELFEKGHLIDSIEKSRQPKAEIQLTINNPGQPKQVLRFPFRSYTSNFCRVVNNAFLAVDDSTSGMAIDKVIKAVTGGITYPAAAIHTMAVNEGALTGAAQTAYGIWIGDPDNQSALGLTSESAIGGVTQYNDYMLRALLPAAGGIPETNVNYLATNVAFSNSDNTLTISRRFQNTSSTVDIRIGEIGLVGKSGTDYFLIARDRVWVPDPLHVPYTTAYTLAALGTAQVDYIFTNDNTTGWTQNYFKMLSSLFVAGNALSQVHDLTNAAQTINFSSARTQKDLLAGSTVDTFGIIPSYNSLMPNIETYTTASWKLSQQIPYSATGLGYSAVVPIALTQSNNITQFGLYRDFEYLATSSYQSVGSSGLVIRQGTSPYTYYLIAVDSVKDNPFTIKPNQILRITYLFQAPLS